MRTFPVVFAALSAASKADSYKPLTPEVLGGAAVLDKVYKWIAQVHAVVSFSVSCSFQPTGTLTHTYTLALSHSHIHTHNTHTHTIDDLCIGSVWRFCTV